ncbi:MAG: PKD domain-containing protein [Bacteroidota bacterium]
MLFFKPADATHIVGGEIYYDNLGGDNYLIHMKVYRDCLNGVPGFDDPAFFTIFDMFGNPVTTMQVSPISVITVPPTNNSPCAPTTAGNACVEEAIYQTTVHLPPLMGGYYITYQRCCRNNTILNLINPGGIGATYWEHIPGPEVVAVNSSPRFTYRPPIYICQNTPIAFDHVATDPDGDSLVYSLCTPFNGLDGCCPVVGTTPFPGPQCSSPPSNCPSTNTPPPYVSVPFAAPFSSSYPMSSSPAININPTTGFLDGVPNMQGQWVVGVCVSEYRNGQLIGVHHRDFQFNVIPCPFLVTADVISQISTNNGQGTGFCNGFTISYENGSSPNATSFHWDFGDTLTTADTSNIDEPNYTFPSPGIYTVTLIANPGSLCADTTYEVFNVAPLLSPDYLAPSSQCFIGNHFNFNGGGTYQGSGTFNWNFGANATPQSANTPSVSNVVFNTPGQYPVVFTVNENGCTASATATIEVWQSPNASIGTFPSVGCDPLIVTFTNTSTAGTPMTILWTFSDGTTSTALNPTHVFSPAGIYGFSLSISTNQNCIDTSNIIAANSISVTTTPIADFNYVSASGMCFNNHNFSFTDNSQQIGAGGVISWTFGSNASTQFSNNHAVPNVTYSDPGLYPVTLIAVDNSCSDTITKIIELYENPVAAISPVTAVGCDPMSVSFLDVSTSASGLEYLWSFSDGSISTLQNPTHIFSPPGTYDYTLTIKTTSKCIDSSQTISVSSITVNPSPVASFTATPMVTTIFDPDIFFTNTSPTSNVVSWYYDFADGSGSSDINPIHTYATWGDYYVTQTLINTYACPNTARLLIRVLPEFRFWIPNAFTPGNKDNLNDIFKPIAIGVEDYTFMIFDRWGEMIYKTNDPEAGWNGTYKNKPCTDDVYVWKCEFRNIVSKSNESHVGHVTLVR